MALREICVHFTFDGNNYELHLYYINLLFNVTKICLQAYFKVWGIGKYKA